MSTEHAPERGPSRIMDIARENKVILAFAIGFLTATVANAVRLALTLRTEVLCPAAVSAIQAFPDDTVKFPDGTVAFPLGVTHCQIDKETGQVACQNGREEKIPPPQFQQAEPPKSFVLPKETSL